MRTISRVAVAFAALAIACIACAVVLVSVRPTGQDDDEDDDDDVRLRAPGAQGAVAASVADDPGGCPLERICWPMAMTSGNQLTSNGTIFGHRCTFLVDTGFSFSVLSARHKPAAKSGSILLEWAGDPGRWHEYAVRRWVATAQQTTNRLPLVELRADTTCLGPHGTPTSMRGELALVQELGDMLARSEYDAPLGGIIGASFLKRYVVTFDYSRRCISYECALVGVPPGAVRIRNEARGGFSTVVVPVTCRYAGRTHALKACIDTGAGASILGQRATGRLLPSDDPARERRTHARFGDGEVAAFEYLGRAGGLEIELRDDDDPERVVVARPSSMLMLPESAPTVSAMSGHDMLLGTSCLQELVVMIDYTVDPYDVYVSRP